jgi:hypothetical protein
LNPNFLSLPPEVRELEVEPPAVASNVLCLLLPLLSATPGHLRTQHGPMLLKERSSRGRFSLTCGEVLAGVGVGAPGPATIPMARPAPGATARM